MKIIQKIKVEGKNINDLFKLDCVFSIEKTLDKSNDQWVPRVELWRCKVVGGYNDYSLEKIQANVGDILVEYSNHRWEIRHNKEK